MAGFSRLLLCEDITAISPREQRGRLFSGGSWFGDAGWSWFFLSAQPEFEPLQISGHTGPGQGESGSYF